MVHGGIGLFNPTKRLARVAFLTAGLLADGSRRLRPAAASSARRSTGFAAVAAIQPKTALQLGTRASCASSSAISSSFENWLNASRSTNSFDSGRRSHVNQNLSQLYREAEDEHALTV